MSNIIEINREIDSPLIREANLFLREYQKVYSPHSARVKQQALTQLILYLQSRDIASWQQCDERLLREYLIFRAKGDRRHDRERLSASSLETHLAALRIFFTMLLEQGDISYNPARLISPPKRGDRLPKVVEAELLKQILDRPPENELEKRDLAILELLYSSGLRLAEIASLNLSHLDLNEQLVRVIDGKGGKDRLVPVGQVALSAIKEWLLIRQEWLSAATVLDQDSEALFISQKGGRLSDRQISRRVKRYAEQSGVNINLHPHLLRHSMATHVLESSQDIRLVQELLGHADISTTQVYTHLNFNHLAKVFDAAHPRAKRKKESDK